ncbi:MAG: NUDIX hydrolase [Bacilli bacterium]
MEKLNCYVPVNEQEERDLAHIRALYERYPNSIFSRENETAHFTASSLILSPDYAKVLLIHHNIYNTWTWTGGHCDGETDFLAVALREASEETGIRSFDIPFEGIGAVDVIPVIGHKKYGAYVSAHLHLNVAFVLVADPSGSVFTPEHEASAISWHSVHELDELCREPHIVNIYRKLIRRAQQIG